MENFNISQEGINLDQKSIFVKLPANTKKSILKAIDKAKKFF